MSSILSSVVDGVGLITLNRPDSYNALNSELLLGISGILDNWEQDNSVKTVVFTGAGDRAFAAGADLSELCLLDSIEITNKYPMARIFSRIESYTKPCIAAVNGLALGGGFELALACDVRIASPGAKFAFPELGLGIIPGAGGTQRLRELAGKSVALHMVLSKEMMTAERAYQLGIVATVEKDPVGAAIALAQVFATNAPIAQALARKAIKQELDRGHYIEQLSQSVAFGQPERREGILAFLEKRNPNFDSFRESSI